MLLESEDEVMRILQTKRQHVNSSHKTIKIDNLLMEEEKINLGNNTEQSDTTKWNENTDEVWTLLASNTQKGEFFATPPTYNAFRLDKKHWLEINPVPWEIINKSNSKCVKWLNEQCI